MNLANALLSGWKRPGPAGAMGWVEGCGVLGDVSTGTDVVTGVGTGATGDWSAALEIGVAMIGDKWAFATSGWET